MRIKRLNWINKNIELNQKMNLYHLIFKPMLCYGFIIWFNQIKNKSTYINELRIIQNLVLRSITGAYSKSNSNKLLEITNTIKIDQEMEIMIKYNDIDKIERKEMKKKAVEEIILKRDNLINYEFFNDIVNRETIWFLT